MAGAGRDHEALFLPDATWSLPRRGGRALLILTTYFLLYYLLGQASLVFADENLISAWYPPPGLSIALLLLFGLRYAPAIFLAPLLSPLGSSMLAAQDYLSLGLYLLVVGVVYTSAATVLSRGFRIDLRLHQRRSLQIFIIVSLIAPLLIGLFSVPILATRGIIVPAGPELLSVLTRWLGDAIGILTVTPLLLVWSAKIRLWLRADNAYPTPDLPHYHKGEHVQRILFWLLSFSAILWFAFASPVRETFHAFYLIFIPLLWVAIEYNLLGATTGIIIVNAGTALAVHYLGLPFFTVFDLQLFLLVLAVTGLVLGVMSGGQRTALFELQHANAGLRTLSGVNEALLRATNEEELLHNICNVVVEQGKYRAVWIGFIEQNDHHLLQPVAHACIEEPKWAFPPISLDEPSLEGTGPIGEALRSGQPATVSNLLTDPRNFPHRAEALARGYRSMGAFPIIIDAQIIGMLMLYDEEPDFSPQIMPLLRELAADIAYGIAVLRAREERLRAEKALRTIIQVVENSPAIVFRLGAEAGWPIELITANFAQQFGYSKTMLDAQKVKFKELMHPADAERIEEEIAEAIARGADHLRLEYRIFTQDGRERWVNEFSLIERDGAGVIRSYQGVLLDITNRKEAEKELEQGRAFLSSAIELLPFPIVFNSLNGEVLRANEASYRFFGGTDSTDWWNATLYAPDTHARVPKEHWPMMRSARGEIVSTAEGIVALKNGRETPVLAYSAPVYIGENIVATVTAFQDISLLKDADRAKNQFLDVLSHELKTPLTSILGWTQAAKDMPEIIPQALGIIERNAQRQRGMLSDLIDISRLLHGKLTLRRAQTELWPLAIQALAGQHKQAQEAQRKLVLHAPPEALMVQVDAERIVQVICNLLDNAIKFTDPGDEITVTAWREDGFALLSVHDTGRGIPQEALARLFEPFEQIERSESTGGLGIGLMLVRGIVQLHGGNIYASSPGPDQGSTFTIQLPLDEERSI